MPLTIEQLQEELRALPADQRHKVISSVSQQDEIAPLELHPSWEAEIQRRVEDLCSGQVKGIPAEEVFAEIDALVDGV